MEFMSVTTDNKWLSTELVDKPDEKQLANSKEYRQRLNQLLTELLLSENLVVLAGLGTTKCVIDHTGNSLAPTMDDLWKAAATEAGDKLEGVKNRVKYRSPPDGDDIELLLSHCQLAQRFDFSQEVETFVSQTEAVIVDKCRFVDEHTNLQTHEIFLRKVARRSTRQPRLKLFTTNYDLSLETAASHVRFVAVDGFSHTQPQEFDGSYFSYDLVRRDQDREVPDYIPNVFHLYKMHGSVDWEAKEAQIIKNPNPAKPLIIYPRLSKFESSYDQPFLEMMSRFQLMLRQPNTSLLVIGCGFNDHHVSQPIMAAIASNVGIKVVVVDPALKDCEKEPVKQMRSLIEKGDGRIAFLASRFEEMVHILPDLVAETEDERHRFRIRSLGGAQKSA